MHEVSPASNVKELLLEFDDNVSSIENYRKINTHQRREKNPEIATMKKET
ncbi:MAG: hypothetical protein ABSB78_00010 [Bacteroidota bacterium]